jgi:hypothetical protein
MAISCFEGMDSESVSCYCAEFAILALIHVREVEAIDPIEIHIAREVHV